MGVAYRACARLPRPRAGAGAHLDVRTPVALTRAATAWYPPRQQDPSSLMAACTHWWLPGLAAFYFWSRQTRPTSAWGPLPPSSPPATWTHWWLPRLSLLMTATAQDACAGAFTSPPAAWTRVAAAPAISLMTADAEDVCRTPSSSRQRGRMWWLPRLIFSDDGGCARRLLDPLELPAAWTRWWLPRL